MRLCCVCPVCALVQLGGVEVGGVDVLFCVALGICVWCETCLDV